MFQTTRVLLLMFALAVHLPAQAISLSLPIEGGYYTEDYIRDWRESDYKPAHELADVLEKSLPYMQKLQLLQEHGLSIVEGYSLSNSTNLNPEELAQTKKYLKLFRQINEEFSPYHRELRAEAYGLDEDHARFQVNDVEPDRLAINDGREIIFNLRGLVKSKLDFPQLLQLLLHEYSHVDTVTPVAERDAWIARVTTWAKSRMQVFDGPEGRVHIFLLPARYLPEKFITSSFMSVSQTLRHEIQKNFIAFLETKNFVTNYDALYDGFKSFNDKVGNDAYWSYLNGKTFIPEVAVTSIKQRNGILQIEYSQQSKSYVDNGSYGEGRIYYPERQSGMAVHPELPEHQYRIEVDLKTHETTTSRLFSSALQEGDFEMYRVQNIKDKNYLSLRLKLSGHSNWLKVSKATHLIVKDSLNQQLLSLPLKKIRTLNREEALLHFEAPARNLEISHILIPLANDQGFYHEYNIRPSKPAFLSGIGSFQKSDLEVRSLRFGYKKVREDKALTELRLRSAKKITGVTMEMAHVLIPYKTEFHSTPAHSEEYSSIESGRKYYIPEEKFTKNSVDGFTRLRFEIPENYMRQTRSGPQMYHGNFSMFGGGHARTERGHTIVDSQVRMMQNIWIHFADGSTEKIPERFLPSGGITLESAKEAQERQRNFFFSRGLEVPGEEVMFHSDTQTDLDIPVMMCHKIFN